jgi:hypothetical protein
MFKNYCDNKKAAKCYLFLIVLICSLSLNCSSSKSNDSQSNSVPDTEAPTAPAVLRQTSLSAGRVGLAWDASTDNIGVEGYRIYRGGNIARSIPDTSYSDASVIPGSHYTYTVAAYDGAGNESGHSNELVVDTPQITGPAGSTIIDNHFTDASVIPDQYITAAKNNLHIAYQHTSHGTQIISGMNALASYAPFGSRYEWSIDGSAGLDLADYAIMDGYHDLSTEDDEDTNGDTPWAIATRTYLNNTANYNVNVIMWSWCDINTHDIERYIRNMENLISEYGTGGTNPRASQHPVEFVFMTGHTYGQGESGFIANAANTIRNHCIEYNRWLFDYYTIESYDPAGSYFGDLDVTDNLNYDGGNGNWAVDYFNRPVHNSILEILTMGNGVDFDGCTYCEHSGASEGHRESTLNCVLKGQAAWHLFARIAGWN